MDARKDGKIEFLIWGQVCRENHRYGLVTANAAGRWSLVIKTELQVLVTAGQTE